MYVVCCLLYFLSYWEKRERGLFSRPLRALDARRESSEASELCTAIEDGAVGSPPSFTAAAAYIYAPSLFSLSPRRRVQACIIHKVYSTPSKLKVRTAPKDTRAKLASELSRRA